LSFNLFYKALIFQANTFPIPSAIGSHPLMACVGALNMIPKAAKAMQVSQLPVLRLTRAFCKQIVLCALANPDFSLDLPG
jgi:hypothetical protein